MARIIALDIGKTRTGIAVTDNLQMIASGLTALNTSDLLEFLKKYTTDEHIDLIVIGEARQMNNSESESMPFIRNKAEEIKSLFPDIPIKWIDERFTSKMALQSMKHAGAKKNQMKDKYSVDKISATLILQTFLEQKNRTL